MNTPAPKQDAQERIRCLITARVTNFLDTPRSNTGARPTPVVKRKIIPMKRNCKLYTSITCVCVVYLLSD
ncbi:hypothetical protein E2C01_005496 [Portunus trituberculatus]|uniref:Uncharacterized protein n=1 Tax=Portunus trituberculatus TaxID=210409 RepID=A0A5B7CTQ4_PORTR|nr:hypothetical protein [Portunus trituberculatus]